MSDQSFTFYRPSPQLAPYVRYYWTLRSSEASSALTFPIGCPQIIFHRKTTFFIPELSTSQPRLTISGQVNFPAHIRTTGELDTIVAVFRPHGLSMFIGPMLHDFYNMEISGLDIADREIDRLDYEIGNCKDTPTCVSIIDSFLLARLKTMQTGKHSTMMALNHRRLDATVTRILNTPDTRMDELHELSCLGKKQFERLFKSHIGMNPKEYSRIARFQKSLHLMQRHLDSPIDYAEISHSCGYSDQSHFIREFKLFSGHTPTKLLSVTTPYSDLFTNPLL